MGTTTGLGLHTPKKVHAAWTAHGRFVPLHVEVRNRWFFFANHETSNPAGVQQAASSTTWHDIKGEVGPGASSDQLISHLTVSINKANSETMRALRNAERCGIEKCKILVPSYLKCPPTIISLDFSSENNITWEEATCCRWDPCCVQTGRYWPGWLRIFHRRKYGFLVQRA